MSEPKSPQAVVQTLGRARFLARAAETLAVIAIVGVVVALALIGLVMAALPDERAELLADLFDLEFAAAASAPYAAAAVAVAIIPAALVIYGLLQVRRLLGGYRRGEIFTRAAAQRLGRVGWAIILFAPVSTLSEAAGRALMTYDPATGAGSFALSIDDGQVMAFILGALLVVIGRVLAEAARISEENDAFI